MQKNINEIIEEHQKRAGETLTGYQDKIQKITEDREPTEGLYLDNLTPAQRFKALRDQKAEKATAAYDEAIAAYRKEVERYHHELALRKVVLEERLFAVGGSEGAAALAQAAVATNGQLGQMLDLAVLANNDELAKTIFIVAERRGLGDLLNRYFNEADEEARALYQEWTQIPSEAMLKRQWESVEQVVPPVEPERLAGTPRVTA